MVQGGVFASHSFSHPHVSVQSQLILLLQDLDSCSECSQIVELSANMIPGRDTKVRICLRHQIIALALTYFWWLVYTHSDIAAFRLQEIVYRTLRALCQRLPQEQASECDSQVKMFLPKILQQTPGQLVSSSTNHSCDTMALHLHLKCNVLTLSCVPTAARSLLYGFWALQHQQRGTANASSPCYPWGHSQFCPWLVWQKPR